ncbi:hypothetical protein, partial [Streptosporangium fragile]|uniref:hypothetical protein n=1 Tax=Streptosporangium fragile TaxID=46186 RepID=UPI0031EE3911
APAAAAAGESIQIIHTYTYTMKESNSPFYCPANEVMIGRSHYGDENGNTTYRCGRIYINGELVTVTLATTGTVRESKSNYSTPEDKAITGRYHVGDEKEDTLYFASALSWQGKTVRLTSRRWTGYVRESNHISIAGANEVMTGRSHYGDENGRTDYEYATVTIDG